MGTVGISLIVASVVWVIIRPPSWLAPWLWRWRHDSVSAIGSNASSSSRPNGSSNPPNGRAGADKNGRNLMPPPPVPTFRTTSSTDTDEFTEDQTTPKAKASQRSQPVPSFSLDDGLATSSSSAVPSTAAGLAPRRGQGSMMPPPPRPSTATPGRLPPTSNNTRRLPQFPAANSAQRALGPSPNRGPASSSGLAPPPTHTSVRKPSRKVMLTPGHSPLDWARVSGPNADLRGVPPSTPYLRITPSMLKKQNGRKGNDAWMGLNGKVYNITPYRDFHPGGIPELMKGAGRDGTKLFGEIHPWVNYDTMLAACLVGLLVEEPEVAGPSEMEQMD